MLTKFFKRRKYRAVRYAEIEILWNNSTFTLFSIIFFENDNDQRKYKVSGGGGYREFSRTSGYAPCETWKYTGLFPEWAHDPVAVKLSR